MKREIRQGDVIPRGYGICYLKETSFTAICYIWPLNHIIAFLRSIWQRVRNAPLTSIDIANLSHIQEYKDNCMKQWQEVGYKEGWHAAFKFLRKELDERKQ